MDIWLWNMKTVSFFFDSPFEVGFGKFNKGIKSMAWEFLVMDFCVDRSLEYLVERRG
jgi:hypothetical protein